MSNVSRRALLGSVPASLTAAALGAPTRAEPGAATDMAFEVTRTDAEWREMLTEDEYKILREGGTEVPKSHPLWDSTDLGTYCCKGCDLPIYEGRWKVVVDVGFLFYRHCIPQTVLTSIDTSVYAQLGGRAAEMGPIVPEALPENLSDEEVRSLDTLLLIEVHCRRCASHLGHLVIVQGKLLHCINGTSLNFYPQTA